ncbi:General substrate transporter [Gordonia bronchialis DSM 43247]|uniref:Putative proline/betaine transporter n=1 Tax=Gordonia bronchialis (strain ATCC 25592 / DSM 43247 / BCRC 13721 / JCM 3198 / KCTC 3076 / NBRC 16047 / NCTC 10667) TaxID=526226 RepID=D0L4M2_GORB4|nr:MFS transporter [Gordonia bronchialis]ACY23247.1 General substrate transporter [Gordonia bronchialis DSM 43247]MCC3321416.1 MFS transporter [Gordonia bronchialis]QGS26831.1 MFS transporter [Gordonia bronchialis]UAK36279.1 MFS transporter [Gordonia bronchialis]STQ66216.1 Proline porter II [Gordonia bronchialis]
MTEASSSKDVYEQLAPDPESPEGKKLLRKAIGASAIGNATEWYDYGVYAAATTYLTHAFFPGDLGTIGTMLGFAISFVLRPLGGMIWGPIGDRIGRKSVLAMTILLISGATALIGLLPTHAVAGVWAPVLLILLRVIQGFSTGGEYGGAATFMAEYAPDNKRGRYGSFLEFGTLAGFCGGTAMVLLLELLLSDDAMYTWGWRIPFLLALPMGLIGLYLRSQMEDTPVFKELEYEDEIEGTAWTRFKDLLSNYWRPILIMFGMVIALNVANYTLLAYQPTYLKNTIGLSETSGSTVVLIGQLAMMVMIPFFGSMSDRTGRKPMWWGSLIGLFVLSLPLYWLMGQGFAWAIIGFVILGLLYIPQLATISATFPAMFPTQVRYAGFAISYNVATAAFGGTAPLVNDAVVENTGWSLFPAAYMMGACAIGMVALVFLKETAGCSIRGTEIPSRENDFREIQGMKVGGGS